MNTIIPRELIVYIGSYFNRKEDYINYDKTFNLIDKEYITIFLYRYPRFRDNVIKMMRDIRVPFNWSAMYKDIISKIEIKEITMLEHEYKIHPKYLPSKHVILFLILIGVVDPFSIMEHLNLYITFSKKFT